MKIISAIVAGCLCLLLLPTASAQAQVTRTWISGEGDDVNPCSRTAPCKTFQGAISKTIKGGEINLLDSCGCGGVTITKSVSIIAEGVLAGVLVASTNGIIINITDPTDPGVVNLYGLDIEGLGATGSPGINGINILNAKSVTIDKVRIRGFKADPVAGAGININPTAANVQVTISNTSINTSARGIRARSDGAGTATVMVDRVTINGVGLGVVAGVNTVVRINNSVITGVGSALLTGGNGKVISFGNNMIAGNTVAANDNPTSTIALK